MLRDVAPTMNKVSHRMGSVQGGHECNAPDSFVYNAV